MLSVLFLGDVVGEPGRSAVIARLPELKSKHALDFVVVNGENAAGGRGITGKITIDLLRAGVSVMTQRVIPNERSRVATRWSETTSSHCSGARVSHRLPLSIRPH